LNSNSQKRNSRGSRVIVVAALLFVASLLTLPFALWLAYAGSSEQANHILTYTKGHLEWDTLTDVDENGVAELTLFDAYYDDASGEAVVKPGSHGQNIVRLNNKYDAAITYRVVLYKISGTEALSLTADLTNSEFADSTNDIPINGNTLPKDVGENDVLRSVEGTLVSGQMKEFVVSWKWNFEGEDATQDALDTYVGNLAAKGELQDIKVGLWITVENGDEFLSPTSGGTGREELIDALVLSGTIIVMLSSLVILLVTIMRRRRQKKATESGKESSEGNNDENL